MSGGMAKHLKHLLEFFTAHPEFNVSTALVEKYVSDAP
jgi:hypothetical protein